MTHNYPHHTPSVARSTCPGWGEGEPLSNVVNDAFPSSTPEMARSKYVGWGDSAKTHTSAPNYLSSSKLAQTFSSSGTERPKSAKAPRRYPTPTEIEERYKRDSVSDQLNLAR